MDYLKKILNGAMSANSNMSSFGDYSPLNGFDNEDELDKNPYQQILSSMPKENSPTIPNLTDFDRFAMQNGDYSRVHKKMMKNDDYKNGYYKNLIDNGNMDAITNKLSFEDIVKDIDKRKEQSELAKQLGIPDGVNIDSTFYNRKDIYDLKERLGASGIDIPDEKKEKPGFLTRIFDVLSTPGYIATTAVHNAIDGDKDTKVIKGMLDGLIGGLTSNSDKYKEGSDIVDLIAGKQKENAGFGEKVGRFAGGFALDVLLDPTTYLTFGTSALAKGATKQVGEEVTEKAVKGAIKGVNGVGDASKVGKYLDLDEQAKRISKQINENAVKHRDGFRLDMPFIHKEIVSAEKLSEIGKALGIQDTIGTALNKSEDLAKGVWNFKKSEDGIRTSLEAIPEAIGRKFDTKYDLKKEMRSNPLKVARDLASEEVEKVKLGHGKKLVLEDGYEKTKELIELMREIGVPETEMSSLMEQLKTHKNVNEFNPDAIFDMIQKDYLGNANKNIDSSNKHLREAEIDMRKRTVELLKGKTLEFEETDKLNNFLKQNGIETVGKNIDEKKNAIKELERSKLPTQEELGIGSKTKKDILKENDSNAIWKLYADEETKPVIESIQKYLGVTDEYMDDYLELTTEEQKELIEKKFKNVLKENFPSGKAKGREAVNKYNKIASEKATITQNMFGLGDDNYSSTGVAKIKRNQTAFNKDYGLKEEYKVARTTDEVLSKLDKSIENEIKTSKDKKFKLSGVSKDDLKKDVTEYVNEIFKGSKKDSKYLGQTKDTLIEKYTADLLEDAKLGISETTLEKSLNKNRTQIGMQVEQMKGLKEQVLQELGLNNVKGASDLYDKIVEQRAFNMLDKKSEYFISPFESVTPAKMKKEINNVWNGFKNKGGKQTDGLRALAEKYGEEELKKLYDGTSFLTEGNFASILGNKSKLTSDAVGKLRSEATTKIKNILYGSKIDSDMGGAFDSVIQVVDKKGKVMRIDEIPRPKGAKKYTKETIPNGYKIVSDEGILQKVKGQINKEFADLKGKKFYDLPKEEQNRLLQRIDKIANDALDKDDYFRGKLDVSDGKKPANYIQQGEERFIENRNKPLREKEFLTEEEFNRNSTKKINTKNVPTLDDTKHRVGSISDQKQRNLVEQTKSWSNSKKEINAHRVLDEKPKNYSYQTRDDKIKALQEEYIKARQKYISNSAHNTAEVTANVNKSLPDGIKLEKVAGNEGAIQSVMDNVNNRNINTMNVKELRQMLGDAGVKGISNAKREKLVEIANLMNSKNIRASIDLTKKTPAEMRSLLKNLGIKDDKFEEAYKRFTGYSNDVFKFKATKDAIDGVWSDKNIEKFTSTMENLYGDAFLNKWNNGMDNLKTKKENFKLKDRVMLSPIELIEENKEVVEALGGSEASKEFIQKYVKLMDEFGKDEISWGIFTGDENLIKSQGYVARRMSDETREILNHDTDKNNFLEAWFKDRANMVVDDPKFAKHRIDGFDGKKTIADINEAIYEATKNKFGEEGAIKNFFEKDLSRILIQRTYEHGNAFYDKGLQNMYLDKMGVKMSWAKGKNGASYNIVENVNGKQWSKQLDDGTVLNEIKSLIKAKDFDSLRTEINSFSPNVSYLPDGKLQKVINTANESIDRLENYIKSGGNNRAKIKELTNDVYRNTPQRGFARELQAGVKNGDIKLIYPQGQNRDITVSALKDSGINKVLDKDMNKGTHLQDFTSLSWEDFEKIQATTKEVPVFAVDKTTHEAYQKALTKQFVKDTDNFLKLYDKVTGVWKKMATTSVGFHTRNAFGNTMQMYLDVGTEALNPKWLKVANEVRKDSTDVLFKSKNGTEYTGKMVNDLFKEVGLGDVTQLGNEFNQARKGKLSIDELLNGAKKEKKNPINAIFDKSQELGDYIETTAKRQQFSILLSQGYDPLEAKKHVDKFLFDYNDLTDFETDFMKRVVPFYTFMRKNTELQFDTILNNPTPVKTVRRMLDNQRKAMLSENEQKLLTDNDNDKMVIDVGGKKRMVTTNLPWLEEVNPLGALNPIIKTPLELATNKNFTFKNDIETYDGQVKETQGLEKLIGGILGMTEQGKDGNTYIGAKEKHAITNALPSVRTVDRSWANVTSDDTLGGLMALLGFGGQEFSENKRTSQEVREYKELLENLEKKAQSKGINTREELKKQKELEQLMNALNLR